MRGGDGLSAADLLVKIKGVLCCLLYVWYGKLACFMLIVDKNCY